MWLRVSGSGFRVQGFGFRVPHFSLLVSLWFSDNDLPQTLNPER